MNTSRRVSHHVTARALAVALLATSVLLALSALLLPDVDLDTGQPFAGLLVSWSSLVLLGCAGWAWCVTILVLIEALQLRATAEDATTHLPERRRGVPTGYRRLVLAVCGLALAAGTTAPALATPGPVHLDPHPAEPSTAVVPARAPIHLKHTPHRAVPAGADAAIVVHRGDSLWRLAAERLPQDADEATIAHTWRRLYAANTDVIGADPDHIEPGQRLARPQAW